MQDWSARREMPVDGPAPAVRDSMLVTADWLKAHLNDADLIVLHADRSRAAYDSAHIPVARFANFRTIHDGRRTVTNELPTLEQLAPWVQSLASGRRRAS